MAGPNCRSGFTPRCLARIARFPTEVSNPINNQQSDPVRPPMKKLLYFVLFVGLMKCCVASITKIEGVVDFTDRTKIGVIKCGFRVETDSSKGVSKLQVWKLSSPLVMEYQFISVPGDVFLDAARIVELGDKSGPMLLILWERGIGSTGLSIIGVNRGGKVEILFEDACKQGYQIVNVLGGTWPQIVAVDGEYSSKVFSTRIYGYTDDGQFKLLAKEQTSKPHLYALSQAERK